MDSPIVGGFLAFAAGFAVAAINYLISLHVLKTKPRAITSISVIRQALNFACILAAYLLSRATPWEPAPLLLGAALGLTIPSVLLSMKLAKINDALSANSETDPEKGDDRNG